MFQIAYLHSDSPLFSNMISPIRVMSTASNEKNMILAHQCPPVPCSCWECINTSPSPNTAAVPRGSSIPNSSETQITSPKFHYDKKNIEAPYKQESHNLPFFLFLSLRFLGCTSPDMVGLNLALRRRQRSTYCFITLCKQ